MLETPEEAAPAAPRASPPAALAKPAKGLDAAAPPPPALPAPSFDGAVGERVETEQ